MESKITKGEALEALENMDDICRMADVIPHGPYSVLREYIQQQEDECWESSSMEC